jgi:tetratricopeptide (TPR) repeat protein
MKPVLRLGLIATITLACASAAGAQEGWAGKTVFAKKSPIKIDNPDENGVPVVVAEIKAITCKVLAEKDGRLQVNDGRGNTGWFDKTEAVPLEEAVQYFTKRIDMNDKDAAAYNSRAWAWKLKGDLGLALSDFDEVVRLQPQQPFGYVNRGAVRGARKDYTEAIADYREAIRLDPKHSLAYNNLAWLLATCPDAKIRDGMKALESAKQAVELDPKSANNIDTLAAAYADTGDFMEAVRWQEKALEDPQFKNDKDARRRLELYRDKKPYRQE